MYTFTCVLNYLYNVPLFVDFFQPLMFEIRHLHRSAAVTPAGDSSNDPFTQQNASTPNASVATTAAAVTTPPEVRIDLLHVFNNVATIPDTGDIEDEEVDDDYVDSV